MPTEPVIDIEALLAPIPGDNPAGEFLRASAPEFQDIAKLLPQADKAVAQSIDGGKAGEWPALLKKTSELLKNKTKDLRITGRLVQALIRVHGFAGLRDGAKLLGGLLDQYWDSVYPLPDEDGMDSRVLPLVYLFAESESPVWVRDIPIADKPAVSTENDNVKTPATVNLYNTIYEAKSDKAEQFKSGLNAVINKTPPAFYINLASDINEAKEALTEFNNSANQHFGHTVAPDVSKLRDALEACYSRISIICKDRNISLQAAATEPVATEGGGGATMQTSAGVSGSSNGHAGPINSRGEALAKLREIAEFLKRAEPHSPVSYLINRAITWSEMPFEQLLLELVTDEISRTAINTTLGIKPRDENSGSSGGWSSDSSESNS